MSLALGLIRQQIRVSVPSLQWYAVISCQAQGGTCKGRESMVASEWWQTRH